MKFIKKTFVAFLVIFALAQIPFAYRRYQIGKLAERIESLKGERTLNEDKLFKDYVGVIHAHTNLGGHSTGTFEELIPAAKNAGLDFVVMTEHTSELFDTSQALSGNHEGVLFVNGQEVETASSDRFLLVPGSADAHEGNKMQTADFLQKFHSEGKLAFVTYPEKHKTWDANFDGLEVFSVHTNAKKMNPVLFAFDALWSYHGYAELLITQYFRRPDDNLKKFDELSQTKKLTLFTGTDAHSNIGFHLLGDDAGNHLIGLKLDPYATIFRVAHNHVLIEKEKPFTQENLLAALKNGNSFIAFDVIGDSRGFAFSAETDGTRKILGDEIDLGANLKLSALSPLKAKILLFRNGEKILEASDSEALTFEVREKGAYRIEVYLDSLGAPFDVTPWIISNPIYVK